MKAIDLKILREKKKEGKYVKKERLNEWMHGITCNLNPVGLD